jgi:hypothetical protein
MVLEITEKRLLKESFISKIHLPACTTVVFTVAFCAGAGAGAGAEAYVVVVLVSDESLRLLCSSFVSVCFVAFARAGHSSIIPPEAAAAPARAFVR